MLDTNIIAKNIVTLRKEMGLTQQDLAYKIHYSDKVISKWERGESVPDIIALSALCDFFKITLQEITKEIYSKDIIDTKDKNEKEEKILKENSTKGNKKINKIGLIFKLSLAFVLIIVLITSAFIGFSLCSSKSNYTIGSNVITDKAYLKVNSINYLSNVGGFIGNDDMLYVVLEIEITNRGKLNSLPITINQGDFMYANKHAVGTMASYFDTSYPRGDQFFNDVDEWFFGVSLMPTATRVGYIVFAASSSGLKNQKLIYTERLNESKTKKYVIHLPDNNYYKGSIINVGAEYAPYCRNQNMQLLQKFGTMSDINR